MVNYQDGTVLIRTMEESDIPLAVEGFRLQGWNKPAGLFASYLSKQREETRLVFVAFFENHSPATSRLRNLLRPGRLRERGSPKSAISTC